MYSKYPRLAIYYKKGLPLFGSDVDFDEVIVNIRDDLSYGLVGKGNYSASIGTYLNKDEVYFPDFRHFNGNRTIFGQFTTSNFQLLDYYAFSTVEPWVMGHYVHHFNGFLINKIPLLRKTKVQAVASGHFLYTESSETYFEYGVGIEHIFKIFRMDYYTAFLNGTHFGNGIRFGIGF